MYRIQGAGTSSVNTQLFCGRRTAETVATKVVPTLAPREPATKRPRRQAS